MGDHACMNTFLPLSVGLRIIPSICAVFKAADGGIRGAAGAVGGREAQEGAGAHERPAPPLLLHRHLHKEVEGQWSPS